MIGTLFLWMYWPSFNGALASIEIAAEAGAAKDAAALLQVPQQYYCVINTLFSLLGSVISTFGVSSFLNNGKFDMMHVQNATLAGGVAMGSSAALRLSPGGAMAVGLFAGAETSTVSGGVFLVFDQVCSGCIPAGLRKLLENLDAEDLEAAGWQVHTEFAAVACRTHIHGYASLHMYTDR